MQGTVLVMRGALQDSSSVPVQLTCDLDQPRLANPRFSAQHYHLTPATPCVLQAIFQQNLLMSTAHKGCKLTTADGFKAARCGHFRFDYPRRNLLLQPFQVKLSKCLVVEKIAGENP